MIEVIPSSIDKDLVYVTLNGGEPVEYRITTPEWYPKITVIGSGVGGNAKLVYIKYKPQFGCEKSANEVVVRDKFASGSVYNIEDLTYKPSKICLALAPKIVSSTGVATDRFGEILSELSKGKDVAVVDGTYQIIDYITYYVNDMAERCDVNTVYDTETRRCETAETQIDTTDILKCSTKDDCLLPTKCTATATCNQGQCAYTSSVCSQEQVLNEVIVFKEMINGVIQYRQAQTLQNEFTGTGQFTFATGCTTQGKSRTICTENCFNIGDLQFCGSAPEFTCGLTSADQGSTNYGQQPNNCWMNSPSFAGSKLVLTKGVKTKVNDWLSVTWYPSGKGVRNNAIALPWSSGYIFEINMKDFFSISNDKNQNIFTILNQQKSAPFLVKNDIANFNAQQSGLKLITDATLLQQASVITYPKIAFTKGSNPYTAVIPTNQLGTLIISANPYIKIKADKEITMYDDETSFYAYNVVTEIPQNTNCNADVTYKCENGQTITIARCNSGNLEYTSSQCSPVILPWVDGFTFSDAMPFVIIGIVAVGGFVLLKKKRRR